MPYELQELAAISGMPGLYRLLRAARHGVLVESLDERATRTMAPAKNKVSLLSEISIYTQDPDQTVPLTDVFDRIRQQHGAELGLNNKSSEAELTAFMAGIIPDYDRGRVYLSDIKKVVSWYQVISKHRPYQEAPAADAPAEAETTSAEAAEETPKTRKKNKESYEPAPNEPLSTAGTITEQVANDDASGNPEATPAPKKTRKKAE
jgi:hypothetical protein